MRPSRSLPAVAGPVVLRYAEALQAVLPFLSSMETITEQARVIVG